MNRIIASVVVGLTGISMAAAPTPAAKPRLVVGIVVDQLRTDYVEQLQDLFGQKGFRTLMQNGVYLRDVDFKTPDLDVASGSATLLTGAWPAHTGVPMAMTFDRDSRAMRPVLASPTSGSINNDSFTPEQLRLSTVADEFAIDSRGKAMIYSVAADPQQAVILAGHAANGAVWLNNTSGLWATSSYYGSLPTPAIRANLRSAVAHRADTMQWRKGNSFSYRFSRSDRDVYRKIALTPIGNREVTDMAIQLISQLPAEADAPGMINIGYTLAPYRYAASDARAETEDAYLRLDAQLGRLLDAVDRYCGSENALIWLSSTGYYDAAAIEEKRYRIPGGEFSPRKARSLLNSYLAARHGNGEYVMEIRNGNVYLDNKAIEARRLDPKTIAADARDFLAMMSGVEKTFTRSELIAPASPETEALNLSYDPKTGGDILIRLAPGWSVSDEDTAVKNSHKPARHVSVMTPAFILAPLIKAQTVTIPVDATSIAPTVAGILRIRSPNGTTRRPLSL